MIEKPRTNIDIDNHYLSPRWLVNYVTYNQSSIILDSLYRSVNINSVTIATVCHVGGFLISRFDSGSEVDVKSRVIIKIILFGAVVVSYIVISF